jgi:hypothetical protein
MVAWWQWVAERLMPFLAFVYPAAPQQLAVFSHESVILDRGMKKVCALFPLLLVHWLIAQPVSFDHWARELTVNDDRQSQRFGAIIANTMNANPDSALLFFEQIASRLATKKDDYTRARLCMLSIYTNRPQAKKLSADSAYALMQQAVDIAERTGNDMLLADASYVYGNVLSSKWEQASEKANACSG